MKSWIKGEEYVITPEVVAFALGVPLVQQPMYPYIESPPLKDIMSLITVLPLVGVLILESTLLSLLSSIICFLGYPVIVFGPFHMYILFPLRDVHSYMLSSLMLL